jgi:hypothetical protein
MQMQLSTVCESVANEIGHLTALAVQVDDMTAGEAMKVYLLVFRLARQRNLVQPIVG